MSIFISASSIRLFTVKVDDHQSICLYLQQFTSAMTNCLYSLLTWPFVRKVVRAFVRLSRKGHAFRLPDVWTSDDVCTRDWKKFVGDWESPLKFYSPESWVAFGRRVMVCLCLYIGGHFVVVVVVVSGPRRTARLLAVEWYIASSPLNNIGVYMYI